MTTYCGKFDGGSPGSQLVCADPKQRFAQQCKNCRIKDLEEALLEAEEVFRTIAREGPSATALELADRYAELLLK